MQFVETEDGYIPTARVTRVIPKEERDVVEYRDATGAVLHTYLETPLDVVIDASTIVPAAAGEYRLVHVRFADAASPALITVAPIVAWRVSSDGSRVEPVSLPTADVDPLSPNCGVECSYSPGVISRGVSYPTLTLFIESRRTALQELTARRAAPAEAAARARGPRGQAGDTPGQSPKMSPRTPARRDGDTYSYTDTCPGGEESARTTQLTGEPENQRTGGPTRDH